MGRTVRFCAAGVACLSIYACSSDSNPGGGNQPTAGTGNTQAGTGSGGSASGSTSAAGSGVVVAGSSSVAGSIGAGGTPGSAGSVGTAGSAGTPGGGAGGSLSGGGTGGTGTPTTAAFKVDSVATWRGNATAAYSIIHDDACDSSALGLFSIAGPELKKRGLHAGFGVIVNECKATADTPDHWAEVKALVADGNDIFSHSYTHPCIYGDPKKPPDACPPPPDALYNSDVATEIGKAGDELKAQTGVSLDFFIFPYDYCAPEAITYLKGKGYLGARCGVTEAVPLNTSTFTDPFNVLYEVFGPAYSYYWNMGACKGKITQYENPPYDLGDGNVAKPAPEACDLEIMSKYVDDTIAAKGWGIREFHGFHPVDDDEGAFEPVSGPDYQTHLDYIKGKQDSGALWIDGPTPVLRYRYAREKCALPTVTSGNTLHFADASADCKKYATVVSYLISTTDASDPATLKVQQGGKTLPAKKLSAGHFVVDANPTAGDAVLTQ